MQRRITFSGRWSEPGVAGRWVLFEKSSALLPQPTPTIYLPAALALSSASGGRQTGVAAAPRPGTPHHESFPVPPGSQQAIRTADRPRTLARHICA
jgi:hypothetical protein